MRTLALLVAAAALFAVVPACGDGEEVQQIQDGLSQTWDGVKAWTVKNRAEAEAFFDENMPKLEKQFDAAKQKAAELGGDASSAVDATWQDLSAKLADLKTASAGEWEQAKDAVAAAYEAFEAEVKKVEKD